MIAAVVLAAGASRRLGRPKQLLPVGGRPLLAWTLDALRAIEPAQIVLVLGHQAHAIAGALDLHDVDITINSSYAEGQSSSLHAGLRAIRGEIDAALLVTGDQPLIDPAHLRNLSAAYLAGLQPIVATDYGDHLGVPLLLARSAWPLTDAIRGDQGARALFRNHPELVACVASPDQRMALDVDTEEDYAMLLEVVQALQT